MQTATDAVQTQLFEVISATGHRRFIQAETAEHMATMLKTYPKMMGPDVAAESKFQIVQGDRLAQLSYVMQFMQAEWRERWCGGGMCGCMGCSNVSGGLLAAGFTQSDWETWKASRVIAGAIGGRSVPFLKCEGQKQA